LSSNFVGIVVLIEAFIKKKKIIIIY